MYGHVAIALSKSAEKGQIVESAVPLVLAHEVSASVGRHYHDLCRNCKLCTSQWANQAVTKALHQCCAGPTCRLLAFILHLRCDFTCGSSTLAQFVGVPIS